MATKKTPDAISVSNVEKHNSRTSEEIKTIQKQYELDKQKQLALFEKASTALKQMSDIKNATTTTNTSRYDRETLRTIVQNPQSNESRLQEAARYFYYRSQIFFRLINWYADMWSLDCRKVTPNIDLTKNNNVKKIKKSYFENLNALERYRIATNFPEVAIHCYLEDVCYSIFFKGEKSSFFYILNPSECRIMGRYESGDLAYAVDASKWARGNRRTQAELLGSPLIDIVNEYDRTGEKWIMMPDEYAACFKFRIEDLNHVIVPFIPLLQSLSALGDAEDIQAILDDQAVYRLIAVPMPVLNSAKDADQFAISPDLLIKYYEKFTEALPDYAAAAPIPGELTNDNVIDFSTSAADKDIQRLQQNQDTLLATSGGGAVINSNKITSTAAFNAWLKSESAFAITTLIGQIEGFTNRMLEFDVSDPCTVEYFKCTIYTKQELYENLLKQCQHSFSDRLALQTLCGISEKTTLVSEYLENEVFELPTLMNHPLNSSYTQSGSTDEKGRPQVDDDELSPSGERSRNS